MAYRILSFDGGGIAGLFSATLLHRIFQERPAVLEKADLLAGTSTGGIIALALADGKLPSELVDLYKNQGKAIFKDRWLDDVLDLGMAIGADYENATLKKLLQERLSARTLDGLSKKVLVPTYNLNSPPQGGLPRMWKPKFFHNFPGKDSDGQEDPVDVAMRTSAAPTFFPSYGSFIDGGVAANDPSMCAVAQAIDSDTGKQNLKDIVLLSFGTGICPTVINKVDLNWGWGQWARPLIQIMINGNMNVAKYQCERILGQRYHRVDSIFKGSSKLDDVSDKNLSYLAEQANNYNIAPVIKWIDSNWKD